MIDKVTWPCHAKSLFHWILHWLLARSSIGFGQAGKGPLLILFVYYFLSQSFETLWRATWCPSHALEIKMCYLFVVTSELRPNILYPEPVTRFVTKWWLLTQVWVIKGKNKSSAQFNNSLTIWNLEVLILKNKVKWIIDQITMEPRFTDTLILRTVLFVPTKSSYIFLK